MNTNQSTNFLIKKSEELSKILESIIRYIESKCGTYLSTNFEDNKIYVYFHEYG
jgi:hypothetical protein